MSKVEILQMGPLAERDEKMLSDTFIVHRYFDQKDPVKFLSANASSIKAIATRGDLGANRELIDALPNLEIISIYGVGFDAVDLNAAREKGVHVTNTPDVLTKDVADLGIAMMLAQSRGIIGGEKWVQTGDWSKHGMYPLMRRVHGKRVGILGLGRIGYELGKRLVGFDMQINYSDVAPKEFAPDWNFISDAVELAKNSDYLFVTLAASAQTKHIVNKQVIEAVGPEGMIINVSRSSNIDEIAMLDALEKGTLGSAAIDVFDGEPNINPRFYKLDNVLLQPHQASGTVETRKAMGNLMFENLVAHFDGKPLLTPVI